MTDRQNERREWLSGIASKYALNVESEAPASSDAGFRSYFRVADQNGKTFIVMDAPPAHEDVRPFIRVTSLLRRPRSPYRISTSKIPSKVSYY